MTESPFVGIPDAALREKAPFDTAVARVQADARAGVGPASNLLALLSATGIGLPQSWEGALAHLAEAAVRGSAAARGQLQALGSAPEADGDDRWPALAASVRIGDWIGPVEKRVLREAPRTVAIPAFLPVAVRDWLIGLARGRVRPAQVYGPDGKPALEADERSNSAIEFGLLNGDVVLTLVRARIAATIGLPPAALENTQILHYAAGQQFKPHFDYLDPTLPEVARRGQRIVTFLVYLNDDFEGGETDFPRLDLRHKGAAGDALYFANIELSTQRPDPRTLHAGLPPTRGEKWLLSQWVRNRALVL